MFCLSFFYSYSSYYYFQRFLCADFLSFEFFQRFWALPQHQVTNHLTTPPLVSLIFYSNGFLPLVQHLQPPPSIHPSVLSVPDTPPWNANVTWSIFMVVRGSGSRRHQSSISAPTHFLCFIHHFFSPDLLHAPPTPHDITSVVYQLLVVVLLPNVLIRTSEPRAKVLPVVCTSEMILCLLTICLSPQTWSCHLRPSLPPSTVGPYTPHFTIPLRVLVLDPVQSTTAQVLCCRMTQQPPILQTLSQGVMRVRPTGEAARALCSARTIEYLPKSITNALSAFSKIQDLDRCTRQTFICYRYFGRLMYSQYYL